MSDKNIENWSQDLKDKFSKHQEPTDAKDFDAFMDKLEGNNFFDEGGKTFSGKWTVLGGLLIAFAAYWFIGGESREKTQSNIPTVVASEKAETQLEIQETVVDPDLEEKKVDEPKGTVFEVPVVKEQEQLDVEEVKPFVNEETLFEQDATQKVDTVVPVKKPRKSIFIISTDTTFVKDTSHVKHRKRDKKKKK